MRFWIKVNICVLCEFKSFYSSSEPVIMEIGDGLHQDCTNVVVIGMDTSEAWLCSYELHMYVWD